MFHLTPTIKWLFNNHCIIVLKCSQTDANIRYFKFLITLPNPLIFSRCLQFPTGTPLWPFHYLLRHIEFCVPPKLVHRCPSINFLHPPPSNHLAKFISPPYWQRAFVPGRYTLSNVSGTFFWEFETFGERFSHKTSQNSFRITEPYIYHSWYSVNPWNKFGGTQHNYLYLSSRYATY